MHYSNKQRLTAALIITACFIASVVVTIKLVLVAAGPLFFLLAIGLTTVHFLTLLAAICLWRRSVKLAQKGP